MHEFHNIARVNKEQIQSTIPFHQKEGKFVVAEFHGLHFVDFQCYESLELAESRLHDINADIGQRGVIYHPTVPVISAEPCSTEAA